MIRPSFTSVRMHYKTHGTHACIMAFPNTCAIRMSEALAAASPAILDVFRDSGKNLCPHGYVRGAQDLAAILRSASGFGTHDYGWERPDAAPKEIFGRSGLICFMNIPTFPGQGHIDLWDGRGPVGSAYWNASPIWVWIL